MTTRPHPHPAGQRARLLPGPSRRPLAGRIRAGLDDSQITSRVVRQPKRAARLRTTREVTTHPLGAGRHGRLPPTGAPRSLAGQHPGSPARWRGSRGSTTRRLCSR